MVFRAQVWLALGFAAQLVSAQLLPSCAQDCVGTTRTKCDATDFHCACTDSKYISKLSKCVENFCEPKEKEQAFLYLTQLCSCKSLICFVRLREKRDILERAGAWVGYLGMIYIYSHLYPPYIHTIQDGMDSYEFVV
jgi:hypothetical protein